MGNQFSIQSVNELSGHVRQELLGILKNQWNLRTQMLNTLWQHDHILYEQTTELVSNGVAMIGYPVAPGFLREQSLPWAGERGFGDGYHIIGVILITHDKRLDLIGWNQLDRMS